MKPVSQGLNAWLSEHRAFPIQMFIESEGEWWPAETIKGMGETLCRGDFLYVRDVMTRDHFLAYGPECSDAFVVSSASDHLVFHVIEIDVDSYEADAIKKIVELTECYRV